MFILSYYYPYINPLYLLIKYKIVIYYNTKLSKFFIQVLLKKKIDELIKTTTNHKTSSRKIAISLNSHFEKLRLLYKKFDDLFNNFSILMEEYHNLIQKIGKI